MAKRLLYLFGEPGVGKITTARVLQERLGWRLFWLHDLDAVCRIVGRYPLPRLMDAVSVAVLKEMMLYGEDVIYVRPSRDRVTVERVLATAKNREYTTYLVRLTAAYKTLVTRVESRPKDDFRLSSRGQLDDYRTSRRETTAADLPNGAFTLDTTDLTPDKAADAVLTFLQRSKAIA